jgi:Ca2+/Na+ antiporter
MRERFITNNKKMETFIEQQSVRKAYRFYLPVLCILFGAFVALPQEKRFVSYIMLGIMCVFFVALFFLFRYTAVIDSNGIRATSGIKTTVYKMPWHDIKSVSVHRYTAFKQTGYFGVKLHRNVNKMINISSKTGMLVVHQNGTTMLIGTENETQLRTCLSYLKQKYNIAAIEG